MSDNKNSYFAIAVNIPLNFKQFEKVDKIDNKIDLVLSGMNSTSDVARFEKRDGQKIVYFFKSSKRKRHGQLVRLIEKFLPNYNIDTDALTKTGFLNSIKEFKSNELYKDKIESSILSSYKGEDLNLFNDPTNYYPWQKKLESMVFNSDGTIKSIQNNGLSSKSDIINRKIIFIYDPIGNSGKSSWFKYWLFKYPNEIGAISYGNTSQLKSAVVNIGPKKLFLIDLPRAKGRNDSEVELLSILEQIKNGAILGVNLYGSGESLLFSPPIVVVSSNYILRQDLLSKDRWESYKIDSKTKDLKDITRKLEKIEISRKRKKIRQRSRARLKKPLRSSL